MARIDQFIGLTKAAEDFIDYLKRKYKDQIEIENYLMFNEDDTLTGVKEYGKRIRVHIKEENSPNLYYEYIEKNQFIVWSSGPMYFNYLSERLKKKSGQYIHMRDCFTWVTDPKLDKEFDKEKGLVNL